MTKESYCRYCKKDKALNKSNLCFECWDITRKSAERQELVKRWLFS